MARKSTAPVAPEPPSPAEEKARRRWNGPSANSVTLIGRLVADPVVRTTASDIPVASLRIVTNDRSEPEFHDVVAWRALAELAGNHLTKGGLVHVEGRLHGRTWQAADGSNRRSVEIVANRLQILSPKPAQDAA